MKFKRLEKKTQKKIKKKRQSIKGEHLSETAFAFFPFCLLLMPFFFFLFGVGFFQN